MSSKVEQSMERRAMIFNIQKYSLYDGPGVRTIVFFKGCPLRCKWCSNPEGLDRKFQVMFKQSACENCGACVDVCPVNIHSLIDGQHKVSREKDCIGCRKCVEACPKLALEISGQYRTISELLEAVKEDESFYDMSGGGVTLSGGECTSQPEAAKSLLMACKDYGINTAIETCGYSNTEKFLEIAEYVDTFLFDIKHMNSKKHNELTGCSNEIILHNLQEILKKRHKVVIRMPLLKGINDSEEEINEIVEFLKPYKDFPNFEGVNLLPYHKLGVNKYRQMDLEYQIEGDPSLTSEDLTRIEQYISKYDFPVKVIRH